MSLVLTEEQALLRDSAMSFLGEQAPVAQLRALRDNTDPDGFSRALWQRFAAMGFTGVLVPEAHGGLGLGLVEAGTIMECIGHHLVASPFFSSSIVAATALLAGASDAQQAAWLPRIASGEVIATLAIDESVKHRPARMTATAHVDRDGWVLKGSKCFVPDGHVAQLLIVAATVAGEDDVGLFLVDPKDTGVKIERTIMVDAHNAARLSFDNVKLPPEARLQRNNGRALERALNAGRASASAELLGLGDEVFARTIVYLKERNQFGKALGEFQALQHRASILYTELEMTRTVVLRALQMLDENPDQAGEIVAIAKARADRSATLAVQEGVQMHGGMGMTDALDIGLYMKRARVLQELFGDANFHLDALARLHGY
jgi:alkylation response protein AidB-like acyl-CoA dehydrogenase